MYSIRLDTFLLKMGGNELETDGRSNASASRHLPSNVLHSKNRINENSIHPPYFDQAFLRFLRQSAVRTPHPEALQVSL